MLFFFFFPSAHSCGIVLAKEKKGMLSYKRVHYKRQMYYKLVICFPKEALYRGSVRAFEVMAPLLR